MARHRSKGGGRSARRGAAVLLAAVWLGGCGGVTLGPDPEAPIMTSPDERADAPEPGSEDWPDDTVPLVTVDLERPRGGESPDAGTSTPPESTPSSP